MFYENKRNQNIKEKETEYNLLVIKEQQFK
jgi:hypothetical protein